jgi:SAM-dependent methyltransferase
VSDPDPVEVWLREEAAPFAGWDFSHLQGRALADEPPWSYMARAAELLRGSRRALDIGTGGGERLLELRGAWPPTVVAMEDHPPNTRLARERLGPLGVVVIDDPTSNHAPMPFAGGDFDLVLDRHAAFNAAEVGRILAPGGTFFTQQVHGRSAEDLMAVFGARPQWPTSTLDKYVPRLEAAGLTIVASADWTGQHRFLDVGALVYYLRAVPWTVPGFSVGAYLPQLRALHARVPLAFTIRSFMIEARRP